MQPQEPIEQLSVQERVALVDPSFHPVLSFSDGMFPSKYSDQSISESRG